MFIWLWPKQDFRVARVYNEYLVRNKGSLSDNKEGDSGSRENFEIRQAQVFEFGQRLFKLFGPGRGENLYVYQ